MPVYLLTNKVTHSRLVVVAENSDAAKRMHPTVCGAVRGQHDDDWHRFTGGHFYRKEHVPLPPGWPRDLDLVHIDMIARDCESDWVPGYGGGQVLAYQDSTDLRHGPPGQEGPDETWGGHTLDRLRS